MHQAQRRTLPHHRRGGQPLQVLHTALQLLGTVALDRGTYWVSGEDGTYELPLAKSTSKDRDGAHGGDVVSPMPGAVVAVPVEDGQAVTKGETLVIIEVQRGHYTGEDDIVRLEDDYGRSGA